MSTKEKSRYRVVWDSLDSDSFYEGECFASSHMEAVRETYAGLYHGMGLRLPCRFTARNEDTGDETQGTILTDKELR